MKNLLVLSLICIACCSCQNNTKVYRGNEALEMWKSTPSNCQMSFIDKEDTGIIHSIYINELTQTKYEFKAKFMKNEPNTLAPGTTMRVTKNIDVIKELANCRMLMKQYYPNEYRNF